MNEELQKLEKQLSAIQEQKKESEWLEGFEQALREYKGDDEVVSFQEMKKILEEEEDIPLKKVGMPSLDRTIGGFTGGDLVTISAPTGHGKTSFGRTLTVRAGEKGIKSFWLSYEMRAKVFLSLFDEKYVEGDMVVGYLPKRHIARNTVWAERKIVEAIVKYQIEFVFIDHLHYLIDMSRHQSISWRIGEVMRKLKEIAIKYGIVIFLIAHTRKTEVDEKLTLSDVRDSSFILQESDFVLLLRRVSDPDQTKEQKIRDGVKYLNEANLMVEKNRRRGTIRTIKLKMRNNIFYEKTDEDITKEVSF